METRNHETTSQINFTLAGLQWRRHGACSDPKSATELLDWTAPM